MQGRCKGSKGNIICDRIGLNILGGYQCAGGDVRGARVTLSVIGCVEHNWWISMRRRRCKGSRGYIICSRI